MIGIPPGRVGIPTNSWSERLHYKIKDELTLIELFLCNLVLIASIGISLFLSPELRTSLRWEDQWVGTSVVNVTSSIHGFLKRIPLPSKDVVRVVTVADSVIIMLQKRQLNDVSHSNKTYGSP